MAKTLFEAVDIEVRRGMGIVLSDHHVELNQGDVMILEGPNGSGKSTLIEAVARLLPLEKGHISHAGASVVDHEGRRKASPINVTLVLQKNGLLGCERVQEHLQLAMKMTGSTVDTNAFLEAFSLTHRANDNVSHLSQGQARKVAVLSALLPAFASSEPCLVLMDEPDAGLDDRSMDSLCEWISELHQLGHGLLISTHDDRIKSLATVRHHLPDGTTTVLEKDVEGPASSDRPTTPQAKVTPGQFGWNMQWRTLAWLNQNAMAALLTLGILLSMGDLSGDLSEMQQLGFILAPALAAGLCGDAMVAMCREERAGSWWYCVSTGTPHSGMLPFVLGGAITLLSSLAFTDGLAVETVVIGALLTGFVAHLLRLAQQSTERLARPQAVFVGLLTPVLILPYALLLDLLTR
ncbi:ATP-binding cassette domain-containing protein [Candidatus Poseidonia alphae]|nr:ATP-binding cassette domain-containing protein [Candidatus Poseidonia alphae]